MGEVGAGTNKVGKSQARTEQENKKREKKVTHKKIKD